MNVARQRAAYCCAYRVCHIRQTNAVPRRHSAARGRRAALSLLSLHLPLPSHRLYQRRHLAATRTAALLRAVCLPRTHLLPRLLCQTYKRHAACAALTGNHIPPAYHNAALCSQRRLRHLAPPCYAATSRRLTITSLLPSLPRCGDLSSVSFRVNITCTCRAVYTTTAVTAFCHPSFSCETPFSVARRWRYLYLTSASRHSGRTHFSNLLPPL